MKFKLRLKSQRGGKRRDFKALKDTEVSNAHDSKFKETLAKSELPTSIDDKWKRLNDCMSYAQKSIPVAEKMSIKEREEKWDAMTVEE